MQGEMPEPAKNDVPGEESVSFGVPGVPVQGEVPGRMPGGQEDAQQEGVPGFRAVGLESDEVPGDNVPAGDVVVPGQEEEMRDGVLGKEGHPMPDNYVPGSEVVPCEASTSQIPTLNLVGPTPVNSQEDAPTSNLLTVPATSTIPGPPPLTRRSRSRSPADLSTLRRSPRLSPGPGGKRQASEPLAEPPAKKQREE